MPFAGESRERLAADLAGRVERELLYLQNILHYSPIDVGLIYLPLTGGSLLIPGS